MIALAVLAAPAAATLADLEALMEKQEGLVLTLAKEVEEQHALRCGLTVSDCYEKSYDNCGTFYPSQICPPMASTLRHAVLAKAACLITRSVAYVWLALSTPMATIIRSMTR